MITLGTNSLARLAGVHPDLVAVIKHAAEIATAAQDFTIMQGLRSHDECCVNWGKGRTTDQCTKAGVPASFAQPSIGKVTWLADPFKSLHCAQSDGFGHAVDIAPYPIDWNDLGRFAALAVLVKKAAADKNVKIVWGGDWKTSKDYPHFELD